MTDSNFFNKNRRSQLEVAEGRDIPNLEDQPTPVTTGDTDSPEPEDLATPEEIGQLEGEEKATPPNTLPFDRPQGTRIFRSPENDPLPRPLNINPDKIFEAPQPQATSDLPAEAFPSQREFTTSEFIREATGVVPDPNRNTKAPEQQFNQNFDTDNFVSNSRIAKDAPKLSEFSIEALESSSIDSPLIADLAGVAGESVGLNFGSSQKLGLVPMRRGNHLNFGQRDERRQFDATPLDANSAEEATQGLSEQFTVDTSRETLAQRGERVTGDVPDALAGRTEEEFLEDLQQQLNQASGRNARENQQRKSSIIGRFAPANIGRTLQAGIDALSDEDVGVGEAIKEEFTSSFDPTDPRNGRGFLERGALFTAGQVVFDILNDPEIGLEDFGDRFNELGEENLQKNEEDRQRNLAQGDLGFNAQIESVNRGLLELTGDLNRGLGAFLGVPNEQGKDQSFGEGFAESFRNSTATQALLTQLGNQVDRDNLTDEDFNPLSGQFGEFGNGFLGGINFTLNLPANTVMAAANSLWDLASGTSAEGENPFFQAWSGHDYTLLAPPSDQKTQITPIAEDPENQNWQQWALALGGDLLIGGFTDALLARAVRSGAGVVRHTEDLAKQFPRASARDANLQDLSTEGVTPPPDFKPQNPSTQLQVQVLNDPHIKPMFGNPPVTRGQSVPPSQSTGETGTRTIDDLIREDETLNRNLEELLEDPRLKQSDRLQIINNPSSFHSRGRIAPNDTRVQDVQPRSTSGENVTKETPIKATEVTRNDGTVVTRQTMVVETDGIQPQTRINYEGNPTRSGSVPEGAVVVRSGKGEFRFRANIVEAQRINRVAARARQVRVFGSDVPTDTGEVVRMVGREADPRSISPPMTAVSKAQTQKSLPVTENTNVTRTPEEITTVGQEYGLVRRGRTEPLRPAEQARLRDQFGDSFNIQGKPVEPELFAPDSIIAKELPSPQRGTEGRFVRKLQPAQKTPETARDFEKAGELEAGLQIRQQQLEAENPSPRFDPVAEARRQQTKDISERLLRLDDEARRQIEEIATAPDPVKTLNSSIRKSENLNDQFSKASDEAVAEFNQKRLDPNEYNRGDIGTNTQKVNTERQANNLASNARQEQGNAQASFTYRNSREKALNKLPDGIERQDIEAEISNVRYDVEADISNVVRPATGAEIAELQRTLATQAKQVNELDLYHGTNVDIAELDATGQRMFSAVDSDVGGTSSEIGIGVHLTNDPEVARNHAQALSPLNRMALPDVATLENGAVHRVGTKVEAPIPANVPTKQLDGAKRGETIRKIFKEVGAQHSPSAGFAKKFKQAIRNNRSIEKYFDQFRRQLAEAGEASEQRVRAFQRDVTRALRSQGFDAFVSERNGETVVNVLEPEKIQQVATDVDLPTPTVLSRKQARKFVDERADIGEQTTKANRLQSEISLSDELAHTHNQNFEESAIESVKQQRKANKTTKELAKQTRETKAKELEEVTQSVDNEVEDLITRDWNPDEIANDVQRIQDEGFFEEDAMAFEGHRSSFDNNFEESFSSFQRSVGDFTEEETDELLDELLSFEENNGVILIDDIEDELSATQRLGLTGEEMVRQLKDADIIDDVRLFDDGASEEFTLINVDEALQRRLARQETPTTQTTSTRTGRPPGNVTRQEGESVSDALRRQAFEEESPNRRMNPEDLEPQSEEALEQNARFERSLSRQTRNTEDFDLPDVINEVKREFSDFDESDVTKMLDDLFDLNEELGGLTPNDLERLAFVDSNNLDVSDVIEKLEDAGLVRSDGRVVEIDEPLIFEKNQRSINAFLRNCGL